MSVDAPLSFGQLYSWREVETYPQAWLREANLPATWDLRGLPLNRVQTAFGRLVDRHESLRTTYHLRDGQPVQRVHRDVAPQIERVDRVITDFGDPDRTSAEVVGVPFAMTDDLGWRGVLVTTDGAPMFVALSFSHLNLDIWATQELEKQFRALVVDPDATAQVDPIPRDLARRQRGESWAGRRQTAEKYWERVLPDLAHDLPTLAAGAQRHRVQATLHSGRLAAVAGQAARQHGTTGPAVVMALVAAALSQHLGTDRIALSLMSSNRFAPDHEHVVGTLNQLIPVVATVDQDASLGRHIRGLHWAATRAYRYSCYDVDRVTALAAEHSAARGEDPAHGCWFNQLFPCWFNYLQLDDQPPDAADQAPAELVWTPLARQYGQPVDVRVSVRQGRASVALRTDPAVIPAEAVVDILRTVALGAERAVSDPESDVKALRSAPDDLAPWLFPHDVPDAPAPPDGS